MEPLSKVRERFDEIIKKSGETAVAIAERSGIKQGHLSELQSGKKNISLAHILGIAKALKLYPSDFLPVTWVRPSAGGKDADTGRFKAAVALVVSAAEEMREPGGPPFITPEEIAEIASILARDDEAALTRTEARTILRSVSSAGRRPK